MLRTRGAPAAAWPSEADEDGNLAERPAAGSLRAEAAFANRPRAWSLPRFGRVHLLSRLLNRPLTCVICATPYMAGRSR